MADPIRVNATGAASPTPTLKRASAAGAAFAAALDAAVGVRFSSHAQKRLEARDIQLNDDGLARLAAAVDRAAQKGGKESLVLMDDLAFIVNVRDRLVVTAIDDVSQKEGVFTQIDSVVLAQK
jgi:flagellar operon protein